MPAGCERVSVWKKWWWVLMSPGITTWRDASKSWTGPAGMLPRPDQFDDAAVLNDKAALAAVRKNGDGLDPEARAHGGSGQIASRKACAALP